jgi:hypothetical protein
MLNDSIHRPSSGPGDRRSLLVFPNKMEDKTNIHKVNQGAKDLALTPLSSSDKNPANQNNKKPHAKHETCKMICQRCCKKIITKFKKYWKYCCWVVPSRVGEWIDKKTRRLGKFLGFEVGILLPIYLM